MIRPSEKQTLSDKQKPLNITLLDQLKYNSVHKNKKLQRNGFKGPELENLSTRSISLLDSNSTNSAEKQSDKYVGSPTTFLPLRKPVCPNNFKYKTEMCKNYSLYNKCSWGQNCFFAHGKNELKTRVLLNEHYKTKICKKFHRTGFCPYSSRCQYFHFKNSEMNQNFFASFEKKLLFKVTGQKQDLTTAISNNERMHKRLGVFQRIFQSKEERSVQERFLEDDF